MRGLLPSLDVPDILPVCFGFTLCRVMCPLKSMYVVASIFVFAGKQKKENQKKEENCNKTDIFL